MSHNQPQRTVELNIDGMHCAACAARLERILRNTHGVTEANVNLVTRRARLRTIATIDTTTLTDTVRKAGFNARVTRNARDALRTSRDADEERDLSRSVWLAVALTLPVLILEMGGHLSTALRDIVGATLGHRTSVLVQMTLTTVVMFGPGLRFFRSGLPTLARGAPDMHSLVAIGTAAAWGYSVVATLAPHVLPAGTVCVYFESAAVIITLVLLGRWLEARARGRTGEAVQRLVRSQPRTARVVRDGQTVEVDVAALSVGDVVDIHPGEKIAVDGCVVEGTSFVDESMMTGESTPVRKEPGSMVVGGTLNTRGAFRFRVTSVGEDTVIAQIIRIVQEAQGAKLQVQALVDKVTMVFVPAVMAAALVTFLVWLLVVPAPALSMALVYAVAVLIVACPCAMGLATPTSITVAIGRAAQMGILFRKGDALQRLGETRIVALDKTGTITVGKPHLTGWIPVGSSPPSNALALVASVESRSEHPIAAAVVAAAKEAGHEILDVDDFDARAGLGVCGRVNGHRVDVGSKRFMLDLGVDLDRHAGDAEQERTDGGSLLYAAIDGELAAVFTVSDPPKETSKDAVRGLRAMGLRVVMMTGDNEQSAREVARRVGIDEVIAEVLPRGKLDAIKGLRGSSVEGSCGVAFVGDGVNDAPALADADVGVAIGTGTDVAVESADVVLVSGDLMGVVRAMGLSRAAMGNIRQNLFWAFAYNTALIPMAAGVLVPWLGVGLSPVLAAGAMSLSSLLVLGNALRLRRFGGV